MPNGNHRRRRLQRVTTLELPPGYWERLLITLRNGDVLMRAVICFLAVVAIWALVHPWSPPFTFREHTVVKRSITARVEFQKPDPAAKENVKNQVRMAVPAVFDQDPQPWEQMQADLHNALLAVASAMSAADVPDEVWREFEGPGAAATTDQEARVEAIERFRTAIGDKDQIGKLDDAVKRALATFVEHGRLDRVPSDVQAKLDEINVRTVGRPDERRLINISEVLFGDNGTPVRAALDREIESDVVLTYVERFLLKQPLKSTLKYNKAETERAQDEAAKAVPDQFVTYAPGQTLVEAGKKLDAADLELLRLEYANYLRTRTLSEMALRSLAVMLVIAALCATWVLYLRQRELALLGNVRRFSTLLLMMVVALLLARWLSAEPWRAELIPLLLFGMTVGIAYRRELALLLTGSLAAILMIAGRSYLGDFLVLLGASTTAILLLEHIRNRSKLIKVGFAAGCVAFVLTLAVGMLEEQSLRDVVLRSALQNGLWAIVAGFLITGLLPFIESVFGVLTEISLLELGDVAHPLLQELVRRAPGTYNHSITVASLGEAAAEAIGAQGLLVRVGAYFHDIGKMLKPGYFAENQGQEASRHDSLVPAMSTLIIIAHIKDGADLARQHHLPEPIVDLIEQHHGTTLVEYFYRRASELSEANPDAGEVEENAFRYPGPKPRTREAAVLMLADAAESACRTLVEPTPSRIDSLVADIARKRLLDGQFDECDLTLEEVHTIEDSLVKSLTAVYHGRVKYPEQRTA